MNRHAMEMATLLLWRVTTDKRPYVLTVFEDARQFDPATYVIEDGEVPILYMSDDVYNAYCYLQDQEDTTPCQ